MSTMFYDCNGSFGEMFWEVLYASLELLIGIGVFLVGVTLFTDKLSGSSAKKLQTFFQRTGKNRFACAAVGAGATAVVQSSTATSVIAVRLADLGAITYFQGMAIIMGACIGTAASTVMVSLSVFNIKYLFMLLVFIGATIRVLIKSKPHLTFTADIFISLGLLFVGLELMSMAFKNSSTLNNAFTVMFETITFPLLLVLIGIIFTALIQSSTAVTAILISMLSHGVLSFTSSLYLIIGAHTGTVITTLIAAINTNPDAKRIAIGNVLFKVFSSLLFIAIIWPLQDILVPAYQNLIAGPVWQLVIFNIFFNVSIVLLMIWFIKPLGKLSGRMFRNKTVF